MKYYKDKENNVYAYESNGSQDHLIGDKIPMTDEEVHAHLNPSKSTEQLQAEINAEAKAYLVSTDWYVVRQVETGVEIPADVIQARAEARAKIVEVG